MAGFSWVIDEQLAGMPRPGAPKPGAPEPGAKDSLAQDLGFLEQQQLTLLVSLTPAAVDPAALQSHGIDGMHLPVADFTAPSLEQLRRFVDRASTVVEQGGRVGVHCTAGKGRTGTFLAAFFVSRGLSAAEAIAKVRSLRPGSIETAEQEAAVRGYAQSLAEPGD